VTQPTQANDMAVSILQMQREREMLWVDIEDLVKIVVDDYHFLSYQVSTFWTCEKSPVGMCIFHLDDHGQPHDCRYCGGPVERK